MTIGNNSAILAPEIAVIDGKPTITSRQIAEDFDKSHFNVIQDIENIEASDSFKSENFHESEYSVEGQNRKYKQYILTRDGFSMIVMGYTGKKAMAFKEAYIKAFNQMEAELSSDRACISAKQLKALRAEVVDITRYMKHSGASLASTIYRALKDEFGYESIDTLPRCEFERAMCFIRSYQDVSHQVFNFTLAIERQFIEMIRLGVKAEDIDAIGMFHAKASTMALEETADESSK